MAVNHNLTRNYITNSSEKGLNIQQTAVIEKQRVVKVVKFGRESTENFKITQINTEQVTVCSLHKDLHYVHPKA